MRRKLMYEIRGMTPISPLTQRQIVYTGNIINKFFKRRF